MHKFMDGRKKESMIVTSWISCIESHMAESRSAPVVGTTRDLWSEYSNGSVTELGFTYS